MLRLENKCYVCTIKVHLCTIIPSSSLAHKEEKKKKHKINVKNTAS